MQWRRQRPGDSFRTSRDGIRLGRRNRDISVSFSLAPGDGVPQLGTKVVLFRGHGATLPHILGLFNTPPAIRHLKTPWTGRSPGRPGIELGSRGPRCGAVLRGRGATAERRRSGHGRARALARTCVYTRDRHAAAGPCPRPKGFLYYFYFNKVCGGLCCGLCCGLCRALCRGRTITR